MTDHHNECDECGEKRPVKQTVDALGRFYGVSHLVCQECYEEAPEPDSGRPDWSDL